MVVKTIIWFIVSAVLVSKVYAHWPLEEGLSDAPVLEPLLRDGPVPKEALGEPVDEVEFNDIANMLALNLFHVMPQKSLVASTLMVRLPLIKLAGVAQGETKTELMTALGYTNVTWMLGAYTRLRENIAMLMTTDLLYINKIYVNSSDFINPYFFTNSEYEYGVKVETVSFIYPVTVVNYINRWMSQSTLRRITDVIDVNDINANTSMIIVNGVHFKVTWDMPFNYARTKLGSFHHMNGSTSYVPMMMKIDYFNFVDTGEYQAVKLRLATGATDMIFVLPHDKKALPNLLNKIYENPKYMSPFLGRMQVDKPIQVKIPRFKIKTFVDWTGFLQDMGVQSLFNCSMSYLPGMFKPGSEPKDGMCLNKIKQKVFIEVDEMGARRQIFSAQEHGAIAEEMADSMRFGEFREISFDRPFLFMVNIFFSTIHNHDLITGVYYGPE